jgi:hypothetical protein
MEPERALQELLERVESHQARIDAYVQTARPRNARLSTIAIVGSAIAAALTAGPAIGGPSFTQASASLLSIEETSVIWRVLCLGALVVSIVSAIAVNLANNLAESNRVAAAETASVELDGLHTLLTFREISVGDAARGLHAAVSKVGFLPPVQRR